MVTEGSDSRPAITHVTPAGGNVFEDLGFPPAEARNLLMRSQLMTAVMDVIERRRLTQTEAAKVGHR
jgi:predicted XRE-type DNA-binding protein